jgi:hypothetical protein
LFRRGPYGLITLRPQHWEIHRVFETQLPSACDESGLALLPATVRDGVYDVVGNLLRTGQLSAQRSSGIAIEVIPSIAIGR